MDVTDFQDITEIPALSVTATSAERQRRVPSGRRIVAAFVVVFLLGAIAGRVGYVEWQRQKNALRLMRGTVEESLAPGEVVVVDDHLLGWALRRGSDGVLRQSVWSVNQDEPASSLLARLRQAKMNEMVVVATPDDRLIQHLDAAGFTVAQEVGWVPWDLKSNGWALLGRGRKRIFFAVAPKESAGRQ